MTADRRAELVEKVAKGAAESKTDSYNEWLDVLIDCVLEEAAKVCESELVGSFDQYSQGYNDGCAESAAAIRALKDKA